MLTCSASASPPEPNRVGCSWWTPHYKIHEISPIKDFPDKFAQFQLYPTNEYAPYAVHKLYMNYNGKPFPLMKGWTSITRQGADVFIYGGAVKVSSSPVRFWPVVWESKWNWHSTGSCTTSACAEQTIYMIHRSSSTLTNEDPPFYNMDLLETRATMATSSESGPQFADWNINKYWGLSVPRDASFNLLPVNDD